MLKGRMWSEIQKIYEVSRSAVFWKERSRLHLMRSKVWHLVVACLLYYSQYLQMI